MNENHFSDAAKLTQLYAWRINSIKGKYSRRIENLEALWRRDLRKLDNTYRHAFRRESRVTTNLQTPTK